MTEFSYRLIAASGLHARPAGLLVKLLQTFSSHILLSCKGRHVNGKELMAVMALAAESGDTVTLAAEGPDEEAAATAAQQFFRDNL